MCTAVRVTSKAPHLDRLGQLGEVHQRPESCQCDETAVCCNRDKARTDSDQNPGNVTNCRVQKKRVTDDDGGDVDDDELDAWGAA